MVTGDVLLNADAPIICCTADPGESVAARGADAGRGHDRHGRVPLLRGSPARQWQVPFWSCGPRRCGDERDVMTTRFERAWKRTHRAQCVLIDDGTSQPSSSSTSWTASA